MTRFDEEPDGDIHGECAAEIHALRSELTRLREENEKLLDAATHGQLDEWLLSVRESLKSELADKDRRIAEMDTKVLGLSPEWPRDPDGADEGLRE